MVIPVVICGVNVYSHLFIRREKSHEVGELCLPW